MQISDEIKQAIRHTYVPESVDRHITELEACDEPDSVISIALQDLAERVCHLEDELAECRRER